MKLTFKEKSTTHISEVFGMTDDQYEKLVRKLVLESLEEHMTRHSHRTKTQVLHDWLNDKAKQLGFEFNTVNDFFMLGYAFHNAVETAERLAHKLTADDDSDGSIAIGIPKDDSEQAKSIIKQKLREAMKEIKEKTGKSGEMELLDADEDSEKVLEILHDDKPKKKLPN